jgi:diaminohydroxyphosphoribosylaminopyrimidine deaminase/5-amino-6-(5-phosphoribosylamino)uracil reductase
MPSRLPSDSEKWMTRAIELARRGAALTNPNPMVGAVLVRKGRVVGQGFHTYDGIKHAEIIALEAARSAAQGSTLYLNLEPCCHQGRTGPCTRALIAAGVVRVVAAMPDPNPAVAGRGFRELRAAGIEVSTGVLQAEARQLNEAFAVWITSHRPLVTLKSAMTLDGRMVLPTSNGRSPWITSQASRTEVHRMRHASDAILTGIGTVLTDDPLLTDRSGLPRRRPLLRVILDSRLRLPLRSKIVRTAKRDVLVFTCASPQSARARALTRAGVEVIRLPTPPLRNFATEFILRPPAAAEGPLPRHSKRSAEPRRLDLHQVLTELGRRDILSLMLEPGPTLHQAALDAGIVDKVRLFYAPTLAGLGEFLPAQHVTRPDTHPQLMHLRDLRIHQFGPDFAIDGYVHRA